MSIQLSPDMNPNHNIPRMTLEFNPEGIGNNSEFSFSIPNADIETAEPLPIPLDYIPDPHKEGARGVINALEAANEGGAMCVVRSSDLTAVQFGFMPLPPAAVIDRKDYPRTQEYFQALQEPRVPHMTGMKVILDSVLQLTNLQYQLGVPYSSFDPHYRVAPARISFTNGRDLGEPRVIATKDFHNALLGLREDTTTQNDITQQLHEYLVYLTAPNNTDRLWVMGDVVVGLYSRLFSNGESSFGQRHDSLSEDEIHSDDTEVDYRLQIGDEYVCSGHNLDLLPKARMMALVTVGAINKYCLSKHLTQ